MQRAVKNCNFILDNVDAAGLIVGYASVFNVIDQQNDIVLPGAFAGCNASNVKFLWQHNPAEPIGIITSLNEDSKGLHLTAKLSLEVQKGREAHALLRDGAIKGLSIGFAIKDYDITHAGRVRSISAVELWEVSIVTFPANHEAYVTDVKSDERALIESIDRAIRCLRS